MACLRAIFAAAVATALFATAALADMQFSTGRQGGSQYPVSVGLVQIMEKLPSVGTVTLAPGGGASNIVAVNGGLSDLAITLSPSAVDGLKGNPPYKEKTENITQLFALHGFFIVAVVPAKSDVKTFTDLAGKKVNVGPNGFTITEFAKNIFAHENMDVDMQYLDPAAAVQQFKDGHLDAWFFSPSDPHAAFLNIANSMDIRFIAMPEETQTWLLAEYPSLYRTRFPADTSVYPGLKGPAIDTVGYPNIIIANKDRVSEQQAYDIVKAVAENLDKLKESNVGMASFKVEGMATKVGVPIHPGAMKYFKERGWQ